MCGKAYCNNCAFSYGYESLHCCPHCHKESSLKLRRSPRRHQNSTSEGEELPTPKALFRNSGANSNDSISASSPKTKTELIDQVLNDKAFLQEPKVFFEQIQDQGELLLASRSRARNGYYRPKDSTQEFNVTVL